MNGASIRLHGVGVRFDFDRLGRPLTPALRRLRRVRATAWGLRDVHLSVDPGESVAVIGATGSGKTTLLRVLAGALRADVGEANVDGRVGSLLAVGAGTAVFLSGRANGHLLGVLAGMTHAEARERLDEIGARARLGAAFERPVHTYSEGMRARLSFAVIELAGTRILLLDEVFEALDHEFRARVEAFATRLRDEGGIVVAAGHDHAALTRLASRAVWLVEGRLAADGTTDEVLEAYREATVAAVGASSSP